MLIQLLKPPQAQTALMPVLYLLARQAYWYISLMEKHALQVPLYGNLMSIAGSVVDAAGEFRIPTVQKNLEYRRGVNFCVNARQILTLAGGNDCSNAVHACHFRSFLVPEKFV